MPRYVALGKFTPEMMAGVVAEGFENRLAAQQAGAAAGGGKLISSHYMFAGPWDYMAIMEFPTADGAHSTMMMTSRVFSKVELHEIKTPAEADALIVTETDWAPATS